MKPENYQKLKEHIISLHKNYDYLNLTIENFETVCISLIEEIYSNNENITYKKTIEMLKDSLDKYVQKQLKDPKKSSKIINNFIANRVKVSEEPSEIIEELIKINNFLKKHEIEETPEFYLELLNNQVIEEMISKIIQKKLEKINDGNLITIDGNHNIQLLLEIYCEKHHISFKNTYNQIVEKDYAKKDYDIDMKTKTIDGFGLYLSQISKPLLTKEEEQRLFMLKEQGDTTAKDKLIEHNLQLVVHIAKSYVGKGLDILDLVQEGNLGLINAIERFDYTKGYKLSTYATWWIRQSIQRGIMNTVKSIRIPVHLQEKMIKYHNTVNRLTIKLQREPSRKEVSEELKITEEQLKELEIAGQDVLSMNVIVGNQEDSESELIDFIASESDSTEEEWLKNCISDEVRQLLNCTNLTEREKIVIIERYGLNTRKPKTLQEIADIMGITRERIRQIEAKALRKIRISPYIKNLVALEQSETITVSPYKYNGIYRNERIKRINK